jgi:quinol monooxygenase YgiN
MTMHPDGPSVIVAGALRVDADERQRYLDGCQSVIRAARSAEGCVDFHLSADPLEADRINVFEHWDSVGAVEAFRGSGPSGDQTAVIRFAHVVQHEVASSTSL